MASNSDSPLLGLVAGLGVGAGIFYYRSLVKAHLELQRTPRILMTHADVRKVMDLAAARAAQELSEYLSGLLQQLAAGGAQVGIIPAFSPQICAKELAELTPIPLISLLDAIADEVVGRHWQRLAVFGARVTMETGLFGRLEGLAELVSLRPAELDLVANIYRNIVENERASEEEFGSLRALAHSVVDREHVDAIILAGTDLSLVFHPENTDFPNLDGARTHVAAIMRHCRFTKCA
jgi:aspartate racemase